MTLAGRLDLLKTQMQETGRCSAHALSVAEMADIVDSLGLDPRHVGIYGGFGGSYLAYVRPYVAALALDAEQTSSEGQGNQQQPQPLTSGPGLAASLPGPEADAEQENA